MTGQIQVIIPDGKKGDKVVLSEYFCDRKNYNALFARLAESLTTNVKLEITFKSKL